MLTIEAEWLRIIQKAAQRKTPVLLENLTQAPKTVEQFGSVEVRVPVTVEVPLAQIYRTRPRRAGHHATTGADAPDCDKPAIVLIGRVLVSPVTKQRRVLRAHVAQETVSAPELGSVSRIVVVPERHTVVQLVIGKEETTVDRTNIIKMSSFTVQVPPPSPQHSGSRSTGDCSVLPFRPEGRGD